MGRSAQPDYTWWPHSAVHLTVSGMRHWWPATPTSLYLITLHHIYKRIYMNHVIRSQSKSYWKYKWCRLCKLIHQNIHFPYEGYYTYIHVHTNLQTYISILKSIILLLKRPQYILCAPCVITCSCLVHFDAILTLISAAFYSYLFWPATREFVYGRSVSISSVHRHVTSGNCIPLLKCQPLLSCKLK